MDHNNANKCSKRGFQRATKQNKVLMLYIYENENRIEINVTFLQIAHVFYLATPITVTTHLDLQCCEVSI